MKRILSLIYMFACMASCSGEATKPDDSNKDDTPQTIAVTSVSVEPSTLSMKVGEKSTLTATVLPENATDKSVSWSSGNSAVATVADGVVSAVSAGQVAIEAKAGNKTASCMVTVSANEEPTPGGGSTKVKISFKGKSITATFDDNATSRYILNMLPHTFPMLDLYDDEMCYRFAEELPTDDVRTYQHELGEIFYWPPGHSFVIRYAKPDEVLTIQHIGQVDSGVEQMAGIGDTDVKFEIIND